MLSSVRPRVFCGESLPLRHTTALRAILIRFLGLSIRYLAMSAEIQIVDTKGLSLWPLPQSILPAVISSVF